MKTLRFGVALVFLFGAHLALAQQGDAKAGKAVYEKQCATCHGADGTAKEPIVRLLKVEIPHLGSKEVQARSDEDIRKIIVEGTGKMRPQQGLDEKGVANVIAYVRSLAQ